MLTITTQAASLIESTTATGNGTITVIGSSNATVRGVCWSTSENPTTADSKTVENGDFGTGAFTAAITGLSGYTLYHVRAYATNVAGTSYGEDRTFTTLMSAQQAGGRYYRCIISAPDIDAVTSDASRGYRKPVPQVTTDTCSSITATSATGRGQINSVRLSNCTRRGFCYIQGSSGTPTIDDSVVYDDGTFIAELYTKAITGLTAGTNYRIRAYAVNVEGVGYGTVRNLLTVPAAPTNIVATKGAYVDKVTITWKKSSSATGYYVVRGATGLDILDDVATYDDTGADPPTITTGAAVATDGDSPDQVTATLSGELVSSGTVHTYTVRAINASGTSAKSGSDTGYRAVQTYTYQWQRSAGDSDAEYSDIAGATSAALNDTTAPAGAPLV